MNEGFIGALVLAAAWVIAAVVFLSGWLCGREAGDEAMQEKLVKSGHAEYYLDEDNQKQWRMKK